MYPDTIDQRQLYGLVFVVVWEISYIILLRWGFKHEARLSLSSFECPRDLALNCLLFLVNTYKEVSAFVKFS